MAAEPWGLVLGMANAAPCDVRILVVDDEAAFATLLGRTLRRLGHDAVLAMHPLDALEQLDGKIDAVITDVQMPVMNGVELARRILLAKPNMPIAFCTGSDPSDEVVQLAQEIGVVLPKIMSLDEVQRTVERLRNPFQRH